jgi:hypothetical protein
VQKADLSRAWFWNVHHIKSFIVKAYNIHYDKSETDLHIYNHTYVLAVARLMFVDPKSPTGQALSPGRPVPGLQ